VRKTWSWEGIVTYTSMDDGSFWCDGWRSAWRVSCVEGSWRGKIGTEMKAEELWTEKEDLNVVNGLKGRTRNGWRETILEDYYEEGRNENEDIWDSNCSYPILGSDNWLLMDYLDKIWSSNHKWVKERANGLSKANHWFLRSVHIWHQIYHKED
jgi:hypothetical protein